jgi:hypothetical protein
MRAFLGSTRLSSALRPGQTNAALHLMPEALRSIGFDPAAANEEFTVAPVGQLTARIARTL